MDTENIQPPFKEKEDLIALKRVKILSSLLRRKKENPHIPIDPLVECEIRYGKEFEGNKEKWVFAKRLKRLWELQKKWLYSLKKEIWAFTGNQFGKTWMAGKKCVWYLVDEYSDDFPEEGKLPIPCYGRIVSSPFAMNQNIIPELQKNIPKRFLIQGKWEKSYNERKKKLVLNNGSTCDLMTYEQAVGEFAGPKRHFVWRDEHGPKDIYDENKVRLIRYNGYFMGTETPENGMGWEFDEIYEKRDSRDDLFVLSDVGGEDNPYLNEEALKKLYKNLTPEMREVRRKGIFVTLKGLLYKEFDRDIHLEFSHKLDYKGGDDPDYQGSVYMAMDYHPRVPVYICWIHFNPKGIIHVFDELELDENIPNIAIAMRAKEKGYKIEGRKIDPLSATPERGDMGLRSAMEQFNDLVEPSFVGANKNFDVGYSKVREKLLERTHTGEGTIHVFKDKCPIFIQGITHHTWDDFFRQKNPAADKKQKPKNEKYKHPCDCIRYLLVDEPEYIPDIPDWWKQGKEYPKDRPDKLTTGWKG